MIMNNPERNGMNNIINILIRTPEGKEFKVNRKSPCTVEELIRPLQDEFSYEILSCVADYHRQGLDWIVDHDCTIELLDMRSPSGNMTYQVSLTFLYIKAVHDVLGDDVRVTIANSLSKGLFTQIHIGKLDETAVRKIEARMKELVEEDIRFEGGYARRPEIEEYFRKYTRREQKDLIESADDLRRAYIYKLQDETDLIYHRLVPSTGYLKWFELRRYKNGVLLRFPHPSKPDTVPPYEEQKLLYDAFSEATRWCRIMKVSNAADLNILVKQKNCKDLILLSEALHEKRIAEIAEQIRESGKRIVLIAGPSSSGKTSFAKRLCIQMRVIGLKPLYLGTDDYFHERDETPVLENGEKDFESLRAIDTVLFNNQMNDLLKGKWVDLPEFDFKEGKKVYGHRITSISSTQPIVIEGIHGLNPAMTEGIPDDQKYRIYISPLTQLNIDDHNRVPTTDARMLRRIVRDHLFRGYGALETIHAWPSVRAGEEQYIFPYNSLADTFFNSHCLYELSVLKKYAKPLLETIPEDVPEYPEARRMLEFLGCFNEMEDDSIIPNNSIMREFIGGSVLL